MKLSTLTTLGTIAITLGALTASAATFVSYTFEDTITPITGPSLSSISWNSGGSEGYASTFTSQARALSVGSFENGEYYQITLNTTGYSNVSLNAFRANGTAGAPSNWTVSVSTTGPSGSYTDLFSFTAASTTGVPVTTFGPASLGMLANNNANVTLRITATSATRIDGGGGAASGTFRLDNLSFDGTAVPEPSTYAALLGVAALGLTLVRRRRLAA